MFMDWKTKIIKRMVLLELIYRLWYFPAAFFLKRFAG
jgi:hypothetical protein